MLYEDDLTDPTGACAVPPPNTVPDGCFGVGEVTGEDSVTHEQVHVGEVAYLGGRLNLQVDNTFGWMWTRREVEGVHSTMRVAAEFIPDDDGRFGLFCNWNDEALWGAVVGTDGSWAIGNLTEIVAQSEDADTGEGLVVNLGESVLMVVECAGLATGSTRLTLWMEGTGPVATYETDTGPDSFDRTAVYAEATGAATTIGVENLLAFGSGFPDDQMTDAAAELLTHVPEDWADSCYQSLRPPFLGGFAEAVITCFIRESGEDGSEIAEYASYLTADAMDAAYQLRVAAFATGEGADSCGDGPAEHEWWIGDNSDDPLGRILCAPQFRGIRFDWTDDRLNILSTLVDFDGSYPLTLDDWEVAGPNL